MTFVKLSNTVYPMIDDVKKSKTSMSCRKKASVKEIESSSIRRQQILEDVGAVSSKMDEIILILRGLTYR